MTQVHTRTKRIKFETEPSAFKCSRVPVHWWISSCPASTPCDTSHIYLYSRMMKVTLAVYEQPCIYGLTRFRVKRLRSQVGKVSYTQGTYHQPHSHSRLGHEWQDKHRGLDGHALCTILHFPVAQTNATNRTSECYTRSSSPSASDSRAPEASRSREASRGSVSSKGWRVQNPFL